MKVICPVCGNEVPPEDVNVKQGLAYCRECREAFGLKALLGPEIEAPPRVERPPETRVAFLRERDERVGVVLPRGGFRGAGCFFMFFALFWNAISWTVALAFFFSAEGYMLLPLLFVWIFPLVGLILIFVACWAVAGRTSVAMDRSSLLMKRVLFGLAWQKRYDVSNVEDVRIARAYEQNDRPVYGVGIHIKGRMMPLVFGSSLSEDEKKWLVWELHDFWRAVRRRAP